MSDCAPSNPHNSNDQTRSQPSEGCKTPRPKNKRFNRLLSLTVSLGLTVIFALAITYFVINHLDEFQDLWKKPLPRLVLAAMVPSYLLMLCINSELLRRPLEAFGLKLTFTQGLALTAATTAISYVIPLKGGSGLRGLYLASCHKMTVTNFVALLVAISTLTLTTASFFAFIGLISLIFTGKQSNFALLLYFGLTTILGFTAVFFLGRLPLKLPRRLTIFINSWDSLRTTPGLLWRIILLSVSYFLTWSLVTWLSLAVFHIHLSLAGIFFYVGGQIHTTLINLTPAGLGLVEAFGVFAGEVLGFTPAQALSAQALNRLNAVSLLAIVGLWGWFYLTAEIKRKK